jgi:hypothetical protein
MGMGRDVKLLLSFILVLRPLFAYGQAIEQPDHHRWVQADGGKIDCPIDQRNPACVPSVSWDNLFHTPSSQPNSERTSATIPSFAVDLRALLPDPIVSTPSHPTEFEFPFQLSKVTCYNDSTGIPTTCSSLPQDHLPFQEGLA